MLFGLGHTLFLGLLTRLQTHAINPLPSSPCNQTSAHTVQDANPQHTNLSTQASAHKNTQHTDPCHDVSHVSHQQLCHLGVIHQAETSLGVLCHLMPFMCCRTAIATAPSASTHTPAHKPIPPSCCICPINSCATLIYILSTTALLSLTEDTSVRSQNTVESLVVSCVLCCVRS